MKNTKRRHPGMSLRKVTVNNKKHEAVTMYICAKNNDHAKVLTYYLTRGKGAQE